MEKVVTHNAAFADFFDWIKEPQRWANVSRQDRQYIYQARLAIKGGHDIRKRISTILTKHGEGRYEVRETIIIHEK